MLTWAEKFPPRNKSLLQTPSLELLTVADTISRDGSTRRGPLQLVVKGLIAEFRILITQFRVLITLLITRGPLLVVSIVCIHSLPTQTPLLTASLSSGVVAFAGTFV